MFSIVSIVEGERSTNCLKNSKTEDSQHDDGEVREEEEEGGEERKKTTRFDECFESYFAKCYCLINSKMAARSFEVWHGSAELDGTMRWHAKKRKPTKSFNHGAGSLLFLLALASPVYVRKLFFPSSFIFPSPFTPVPLPPVLFLTDETWIAFFHSDESSINEL